MNKREVSEAKRLVDARNTLRVAWSAYDDPRNLAVLIGLDTTDVKTALEVALDEIDLALLRCDNVTLDFEHRGDNENDSQ